MPRGARASVTRLGRLLMAATLGALAVACNAILGLDPTALAPPDAALEAGSDAGVGDSDVALRAYRDEVLADRPIAYWRLDEKSRDAGGADQTSTLNPPGYPVSYVDTVTLGVPGALR